jgi:hypothetical protein
MRKITVWERCVKKTRKDNKCSDKEARKILNQLDLDSLCEIILDVVKNKEGQAR